ncbi:MAG TPA: hypothetical protein VHS99_10205 [Chloroflexota bacterium]|nr:hypothetical protein [Chloroflexota bacterium]
MVTVIRDTEAVKQALAAGRITVLDPSTGYHRSMYAECSRDGQAARIWRVVRSGGGAITELTMRCTRCGAEFAATPESLYLR